ncbi:MAG TPA: hypothetical protein VGG06_29105, partial [Thermoanaerobaculia bacterium]
MTTSRLMDFDWVETNSPVASSRTDDIHFFDPRTGWLVNSNGQIALTEDGGDHWTVKLAAGEIRAGDAVLPGLAAVPGVEDDRLDAVVGLVAGRVVARRRRALA